MRMEWSGQYGKGVSIGLERIVQIFVGSLRTLLDLDRLYRLISLRWNNSRFGICKKTNLGQKIKCGHCLWEHR